MRAFVDEARVEVAGGDGGNGCVSFLRQKYQPRGRPDGGSGGDGGSVIFRVDTNIATLAEMARLPHQRAEKGRNGQGTDKHGARGEDRVLLVPDGTQVWDEDGTLLADLVNDGTEFVAAAGGRGGRGNATLATARRRAPSFAERGEPGIERSLRLELKVLADVGLVGFPNAGKSSLIARLSAARPKIAAYPFTTLTPNLGVATAGDARFVVADVPGLIEGASEGRGLGLSFLRHLERCRVMCFVVDIAADDAREAVEMLRAELRAHDPTLIERPSLLAANKIDLAEWDPVDVGMPAIAVSAETGEGIDALNDALGDLVTRGRIEQPIVSHLLVQLRPDGDDVEVFREDDAWRVRSVRAEKLLLRYDLNNDEALGFVQEKLLAMGVEEALTTAGARVGDEVRIGEMALEFTPETADSDAP